MVRRFVHFLEVHVNNHKLQSSSTIGASIYIPRHRNVHRQKFQDKNEEAMRSQERERGNNRIEQRFLEINRQNGELTSMVRTLTENVANGREENDQNVQIIETSLPSDTDQKHNRRQRHLRVRGI